MSNTDGQNVLCLESLISGCVNPNGSSLSVCIQTLNKMAQFVPGTEQNVDVNLGRSGSEEEKRRKS